MLNSWETISPLSAQMFSQGVVGAGFDDPMTFHSNLMKALSSSSTIDTNLTDGTATPITALRLEDLSGVLTLLTHSQEHLVFWRWLKKGGVFNVDYQYNVQTSYGRNEASPFYMEGGKPIPSDDQYLRRTRSIKFIGVEREMTLIALLQRTGGGVPDLKTRTTQTGTLDLLAKLERMLFYGREELDTSGLSFNGLEKQMLDSAPTDNVIDLKGYALTPGRLDDALKVQMAGYSNLRDLMLFCSLDTLTNFTKPYRTTDRERIMLDAAKDGFVVAGNAINGYRSQFGYLPFQHSIFMGKYRSSMKLSDYLTADDGGDGTYAPNSIPATITVSPAVNAASELPAATYWYSITSKNRYGTSAPVHTPSGTTIGAGYQLTLAWTAPLSVPTGGAPVAYYLWRHTSNPATAANQASVKLMREVTATAPLSYVDVNQWRPGTDVAFSLDGEFENLSANQLSPLMRFPLATITTAYRYLLLMFIDLAVKAHQKHIMFKNVGTTV